MRTFVVRKLDTKKLAGNAVLAEGVEFSTGRIVIQWITRPQALCIYDSMDAAEQSIKSQWKARVVWIDNHIDTCIECLAKLRVDADLNQSSPTSI